MIALLVFQQLIVSYVGQVIIFKVVDEHRKPF